MGACCENEGLPLSSELVLVDQPKTNRYRQEKMVTNLAPVCIRGADIKELPHNSIVALRIKDPLTKNRFFYGSGALISNNLIMTAAHNIYDKLYSRQFQKEDFQIFQGVDGVAEQFFEVQDWRYMEQFKTCSVNNKLKYDYALIKLKPNSRKPISHNKFLDLGLPCGCILNKEVHLKLEVYGYPQYRQNYEPQNKELTRLTLFQYGLTVPDSILQVDSSSCKISYAANTLGGQSGCPVVVNNQIIAIHTGSSKDEGNQNIGRLVTADLIRKIADWTLQLKGQPFNFIRGVCAHKKQARPQQRNKDPNLIKAEKLQLTAERLKGNYRYQASLQNYAVCLAIYEEIKGKDSVEVANILVNGIGDIKDEQGKYQQALMAYRRALEIYRHKEGEESHGVASALQRIGAIYHQRGEYVQALEQYRKTLVICQKIYGSNSLEVAYTINNVGLVYRDQAQYTLALGRLFKSLAIYQKLQKANSVEVAFAHNNIGSVYYSKRQWQEALQHFSEALNIYQNIKGRGSVEAARTLMNIGLVYDGQGDALLAIEMYHRCIEIYERHSLRHRAYANAHADLATSYWRIRDYKSAAVAYGVSLTIYEQIGLAADLKKNSLGLVRSLRKLGQTEQSKKVMEKYGLIQDQV